MRDEKLPAIDKYLKNRAEKAKLGITTISICQRNRNEICIYKGISQG
jgi:hypothetical protein